MEHTQNERGKKLQIFIRCRREPAHISRTCSDADKPSLANLSRRHSDLDRPLVIPILHPREIGKKNVSNLLTPIASPDSGNTAPPLHPDLILTDGVNQRVRGGARKAATFFPFWGTFRLKRTYAQAHVQTKLTAGSKKRNVLKRYGTRKKSNFDRPAAGLSRAAGGAELAPGESHIFFCCCCL